MVLTCQRGNYRSPYPNLPITSKRRMKAPLAGLDMDFDEAAISHLEWKDRLIEYLAKRDGSLNPFEVALDDRCPLGQWIHGEGSQYSSYPEYAALKRQHARFHKAVGDVVGGTRLGLTIKTGAVLSTESEFGEASAAVITAIMGPKRKAAPVFARWLRRHGLETKPRRFRSSRSAACIRKRWVGIRPIAWKSRNSISIINISSA